MTLREELLKRENFDPSYLLWAAEICEDVGCTENANGLRDAAISWYEHRGMQQVVDKLKPYCRHQVYRVLE